MQDNKNTMSLKSIDRIFDLIEALSVSSSGMYVQELSEKTGIPESAAGRILQALSDKGYTEQHCSTWKLSMRCMEHSSAYLNVLDLKSEAEPFLHQLSRQIGQTVFLASKIEDEAVYINKVERFNSLRKYSIIGQRRPLYCTALGKALLIGYSDDQLQAYFYKIDLKKFTPATKTDAVSIMKEILQAGRLGWTLDAEEYESGVMCAAAPIYDYRKRIIASVSASGYAEQIAAKLPDISQAVRKAAFSISKRMGYKISQQTEERLHL